MTQDTIETIRNGLAAWSRGDREGALVGLDPEIEFFTSGMFPGLEPVYRGHAGFRRFFTDFRGAWEDISVEVERIVEGEPGRFAVAGRFHATARDGLPVARPVGMVFTAGDGGIARIQSFGSWDEAFAAAGVPDHRRDA